jgi:pyridoxine kinase
LVPDVLSATVASVFGILERTAASGSRELLLIEAQDEFVAPSRRFPVESIGRLA